MITCNDLILYYYLLVHRIINVTFGRNLIVTLRFCCCIRFRMHGHETSSFRVANNGDVHGVESTWWRVLFAYCFEYIMIDRPEPIIGLRLKVVSSPDYIMRDLYRMYWKWGCPEVCGRKNEEKLLVCERSPDILLSTDILEEVISENDFLVNLLCF